MKKEEENIHSLFQRWRVARNDENYEKFYNATKDIVQRIALVYSKNKDYSEELTQTIFIKIYKMQSDELPRLDELNWLYSLTKNEVILYMEKLREVKMEEIFVIPDGNNNLDDIIDKNQYNSIIFAINYKQQEVIALSLIGKFDLEEISNLLDKKISVIKWYYYKSFGSIKIGLLSFALALITFALFVQAKLIGKNKSSASITNLSFFENTESSYLISSIIFFICTLICMIIFFRIKSKMKKNR